MKSFYLKLIISSLLFMAFNVKQVKATVNVTNVSVTTLPVTACSPTDLTITGTLGSSSYTFVRVAVTHTGFNIRVNVRYNSGGIGLPVITNFTQTASLGTLAPGTYTVTTNGILSGALNSTVTTTIVVPNLPIVDLGPDTTICMTDSILLDATTPNIRNYLWQDQSTDSTLWAKSSGLFWVHLTDSNWCTTSDTIIISTINCVTSIEEVKWNRQLSVYPNPAKEVLNLQLPDGLVGKRTRVQVYNAEGRLLRELYSTSLDQNLQLDVNELSNGLYFIQLSDGLNKWDSKFNIYY